MSDSLTATAFYISTIALFTPTQATPLLFFVEALDIVEGGTIFVNKGGGVTIARFDIRFPDPITGDQLRACAHFDTPDGGNAGPAYRIYASNPKPWT
jgi:hypothetical protein